MSKDYYHHTIADKYDASVSELTTNIFEHFQSFKEARNIKERVVCLQK